MAAPLPTASRDSSPKPGEVYIVRPKDSLWKVASQLEKTGEYPGKNTPALIAELKRLNSGVLKGSDTLHAGMQLSMPPGMRTDPAPPAPISPQRPVRVEPPAPIVIPPAVAPVPSPPSPPQAHQSNVHVVADGETLSAIAKNIYGSENKWRAIARANPDINPNKLQIGQKITLPDLGGATAPKAAEAPQAPAIAPPRPEPAPELTTLEKVVSFLKGERLDRNAPPSRTEPDTFSKDALGFTLGAEGGISSDRNDPGNRTVTFRNGRRVVEYTLTNKGVTQEAYNSYRRQHGSELQSVARISQDEIVDLYKTNYWNAVQCDRMPKALAISMFDTCVNMGPGGATAVLQATLGLKPTGVWGPQTEKAFQNALAGPLATAHGTDQFVNSFLEHRMDRYRRLIALNPKLEKYKNGWSNRMTDLAKHVGSKVYLPPLIGRHGETPSPQGSADDLATAVAEIQAAAGLRPTGVIDEAMNERLNAVK